MDEQRFKESLHMIETDRQRGASELARVCLTLIAESARNIAAKDGVELMRLLEQRAAKLALARPSMAPIRNLLDRWCSEITTEKDLSELRLQAAHTAEALIDYSRWAVVEAAGRAASHIGPGKRLMTHSLSSTVLAVFQQLRGQGLEVIVTESRPLNEGHLLAKRLSEWAIPTTLITDAQMGLFGTQADAVIVGADTLLQDGGVINKVGTYLLALVARDQGIPFYVCCESFKRLTKGMETPELEHMEAAELGAPPLPGVDVQNVYFDITPARLVNAWFDENRSLLSA